MTTTMTMTVQVTHHVEYILAYTEYDYAVILVVCQWVWSQRYVMNDRLSQESTDWGRATICSKQFYVSWVPIQPRRLAHQRPYVWDKEILWLIFFHILELQIWEFLKQTKTILSQKLVCSKIVLFCNTVSH